MPNNTAKPARERSTSRRSTSKSNDKHVEFVNDTIHVLSSNGHSQEGDDGENNEDLECIILFSNLPEVVRLISSRVDQEQLSALFQRAGKRDLWPGQFAETVRAREEAVVKRIKEIQDKSIAEKHAFDAEIAPLINAALGGIMDAPPDPASFSFPIQVDYLGAETQPYCEAMSSFLQQAGGLSVVYDQLAERQIHESRLGRVAGSFKKDKEVTETTVAAGKKVAAAEIERLLTDRFHEVRAPNDLSVEDEHKGGLLLSRGTDKQAQSKQNLGWGNVAKDAEGAIKELCFAGEPDERH